MDKTKYQRHIRSRIGLYSIGLNTYWNQFNGLKDRIIGYNKFIEKEMGAECDMFNFANGSIRIMLT